MPKLGGSTLHVILPYICESSRVRAVHKATARSTEPCPRRCRQRALDRKEPNLNPSSD